MGEAVAAQLVTQHSGTRITMPKRVTPASKLAGEIGLDGARRLVEHLGHSRAWKVPSCKRWRVQLLRAQGQTHREIARTLCLDESTAGRYLAYRRR